MKKITFLIFTLICTVKVLGLEKNLNTEDEIAKLSASLAAQIKESGRKKVSVVDFSDLQGNFTELGRYVAEQITVNMVSHRKDFSMVDRANLKRILQEHKLTLSGLIDPENAKKFGQISGVDALVVGNVIPLKNDIQITAKIIATDTAEIVGADKGKILKGDEILELLGRSVVQDTTNVSGTVVGEKKQEIRGKAVIQKFDNFNAELLSFRLLPNGTALVAFQISNTSKQIIALGFNSALGAQDQYGNRSPGISAKISDDQGNLVRCEKVEGLYLVSHEYMGDMGFRALGKLMADSGFEAIQRQRKETLSGMDPYGWVDNFAEINPGESLRFTLEFFTSTRDASQSQNRRQEARGAKLGKIFKLQAELISIVKKVGDNKPNPKLSNIYLDGIVVAEDGEVSQ